MRTTTLLAALAVSSSFTTIAAAAEPGDLLVRGRLIGVLPTEETSGVEPAFPDGSVEVENAYVPELDFTYFFTDRIAAELILATSPHDLEGTGDLEGLGKVADVWALPPTVTVQYHFPLANGIKPYVGAGLNYTLFYNEDASDSLTDAVGDTKIELDDSFGLALQVGVDMPINDTWMVNADVKYIQIDTTATLTTGALVNTVDVDLDPFVVGLGVGRTF
ncbi:outer membrane protein OmpW [Parvularcula bermudensis HTCC2503]|uniref:Outer membrane protein OmpW n=1 Tax=Parvularcula bermudensis (strain ATCC BAA-594 / HTCC2503 / KCTC 12087) TaxID=314260 RepID=E0THD6_PARBH|nr:OmpW family protein [Parvularcula bermudensis]ADM10728.1 outer membrane protein OmpW [Parvularcula bermudensis HTCC2503]